MMEAHGTHVASEWRRLAPRGRRPPQRRRGGRGAEAPRRDRVAGVRCADRGRSHFAMHREGERSGVLDSLVRRTERCGSLVVGGEKCVVRKLASAPQHERVGSARQVCATPREPETVAGSPHGGDLERAAVFGGAALSLGAAALRYGLQSGTVQLLLSRSNAGGDIAGSPGLPLASICSMLCCGWCGMYFPVTLDIGTPAYDRHGGATVPSAAQSGCIGVCAIDRGPRGACL